MAERQLIRPATRKFRSSPAGCSVEDRLTGRSGENRRRRNARFCDGGRLGQLAGRQPDHGHPRDRVLLPSDERTRIRKLRSADLNPRSPRYSFVDADGRPSFIAKVGRGRRLACFRFRFLLRGCIVARMVKGLSFAGKGIVVFNVGKDFLLRYI